ncbi:MAG: hybrid sensor histidine kinase/response regulator [Armatimonadetes bacterium]|nr:hybrid sensor histidine kinase/response regulator [Armatimonadota bacterium]
MFGVFIISCGTGHLVDYLSKWWPAYRFIGSVKVVTALASWATVIALIPIIPAALQFKSPKELERRVAERTEELERLNMELQNEAYERERAQRGLQEADRRKDEFLAMLAHELRNPMYAVNNALYLLKRGATDPSQQRYLDMLERQVSHQSRLVDDLLDVSRITQGKIDLNKSELDLGKALKDAIQTSRAMRDAKNQQASFEEPEEAITIYADPTRLEQIFTNLLNNASKYSPDGTPIRVSAATEGDAVKVWVKDEGVGIDPKLLPHIFDPFFQSEQTIDRSLGGLGLGLSLVKKLVHLHGGEVTAHSNGIGQGATFEISLPRYRPEAPGAALVREDSAETVEEGMEKKRVLIVEDNADNLQTIRDVVTLWGYQADVATDGRQALERAEQFTPFIVLLDIGLPILSGYEVAQRLKAEPHPPVIIALTGYGQEADRKKALQSGCDYHLTKPIPLPQLEDLMRAVSK